MYAPSFNRVEDEEQARRMVAASGAAELVTVGADGYPVATLLPVLWRGGTVLAHMARANPHWREIGDGSPALLVAAGPQAYVSPSWYAAKAEHGRVVPTWNYTTVHLTGRVRVHDDVEWLRGMVTALTDAHESHREHPWAVTDAPSPYVEGQLRGIVGIELTVERVEAKAKLSQNRSDADRAGVVAGLRAESTPSTTAVADLMDQPDA
ncbi:FMN-binding negative transcriptional regulator [Knoellia sp. 3-2P3]|uniref:FMN-binding negative transcriptional regulator n=1 Tax=unclassified Knoellia TaxID=2618719 RepID=UPI0023DAC7B3|nr:FMN-binding negative transcriptional regulator [Knoellia sp. 3-2P3]MDF2092086.1 FMN-binding negative transcriptional regulator [Knoellia sp. 3-2P3]